MTRLTKPTARPRRGHTPWDRGCGRRAPIALWPCIRPITTWPRRNWTRPSHCWPATKLLSELQKMAGSGSISIKRTYSGAAGTLLLAQKKYRDAAAQLEQDFMNPVSIRLLITAEQKANAKAAAEEWRVKLLDWKIPTVEEALTVFAFRAQQKAVAAKK